MFYSNGDSYGINSRADVSRESQNSEAQACQQKFIEDAYGGNDKVSRSGFFVGADAISPCPRVDSIDPYSEGSRFGSSRGRTPEPGLKEQGREMTHYRQQMMEMERRLLAEIYYMAAIYMAEIYRYSQHHHIYSSFRHWVRPRYWWHEAQSTEAVGARLQWPRGIWVMPSGVAAESRTYIRPLWHNWNQQHPWRNWGKEAGGFVGTLIADARNNIGQPVWAFTRFASVCQSGNLGCAATVSELLQESGVRVPGSAGVYGLVDQLSAAGWQRIKISDKNQFRPGDVVFGVRGPHGHIGIISQVNNNQVLVCDNSSSSGTLKERTIESGGSFIPNGRFAGSLYVMRANG